MKTEFCEFAVVRHDDIESKVWLSTSSITSRSDGASLGN
jgi:hypothetical protein